MQIKTLIFYLIFYCSAYLTPSLAAELTLASENRTDLFNKRVLLFEKICIENGVLSSLITDSRGVSLDCRAEAHNLKQEEKLLDFIQGITLSPLPSSGCIEKNNFSNNKIIKLSHASLEAANSLACTEKYPKNEDLSCIQQVGCNVLRSVSVESVTSIFHSKFNDNSCLATNKSDCLSELIAGILKNLWVNTNSFWSILKIVSKTTLISIKKTIISWVDFIDPINKHADSALAACNINKDSLKLFMSDAKMAIMKMSNDIYQLIAKGIKESFMCKKWAAQPHLSQCLIPQDEPWMCASCDQKINSICGVAGFAAGEIAVAYVTGGVLNLGKSAIDSVGITSAVTKLTENYPKIAMGKKVFIKIEKINLSVIDLALNNKIIKSTVRVVSYPLTPYTNLMQKAYQAGMKDSKILASKIPTQYEIELLSPENILIQANTHILTQSKSYTNILNEETNDEAILDKKKKIIKEEQLSK